MQFKGIDLKLVKGTYLIAAFFMALAVMIGAFGAHGLKEIVTGKFIQAYKTGVTYHFYHTFGIFLVGVLSQLNPQINLKKVAVLFLVGILLFSFNCYLYALTQIKVFAMIVPIGGASFILGWLLMAKKLFGLNK